MTTSGRSDPQQTTTPHHNKGKTPPAFLAAIGMWRVSRPPTLATLDSTRSSNDFQRRTVYRPSRPKYYSVVGSPKPSDIAKRKRRYRLYGTPSTS